MATKTEFRPKSVLFVTSGLRMGGAEIYLLRLLERLDRKHFSPTVLSMLDEGQIGPKIRDLGIELKTLQMQRPLSFVRHLVTLPGWLRPLKPDIVHGWMYHGNLLAAIIAFFWRTRLFFSIHGAVHNDQGEKPLTSAIVRINARLSGNAEGIVYCSPESAREHEDIGFESRGRLVIPSGYDCEIFKPEPADRQSIRRELGISPSEFVIGMFGRYHPVKDFPSLIKAFSRIHQRFPELRLILAGDGVEPDNPELKGWLADAGILDVTSVLGIRSDMPRIYRALDVLAMTSICEVGPMVVGEAMACGVPCLATNVGIARQMIGDSGRIVEVGNTDQIENAMLEFLRMTPEEKDLLGLKAREIIKCHWDIAKMAQCFARAYEVASMAKRD